MNQTMRTIFSFFLLLFSGFVFCQQVSFKIEISNLQNSDGSVLVSVFKDQEGFEDEVPVKLVTISKGGSLKDGVLKTEISLPPDNYGVALVDDENNDGDMNYNFVGKPLEGFGFSDYYHTGFSKPKFSDFSFNLTEDTDVVKVKMRYM